MRARFVRWRSGTCPTRVHRTWSLTPGRCCWAWWPSPCCARHVRCGVIRWARGQGADALAALEVPGGDPDRLPVAAALTRALAREDGDALDAAVGGSVQARVTDALVGIAGARCRCCSSRRAARPCEAPVTPRGASCTCWASTHRPGRDARPAGDAPQAARDPALRSGAGPGRRHHRPDRHRGRFAHRCCPCPLPAPTRRLRPLPG